MFEKYILDFGNFINLIFYYCLQNIVKNKLLKKNNMTNKTNQCALGLENLFKKPDFSIKSYLLIRKKSQKYSGSPDIPKIKQPK